MSLTGPQDMGPSEGALLLENKLGQVGIYLERTKAGGGPGCCVGQSLLGFALLIKVGARTFALAFLLFGFLSV